MASHGDPIPAGKSARVRGSLSGLVATAVLLSLLLNPAPAAAGPAHDWQWVNPLPLGKTLYAYADAGEGVLYAAGDGGAVLRSEDLGATWTALATDTVGWLEGAAFTDPLTGTLVGEEDLQGIILRTTDGGSTWEHQETESTPWLEGVDFLDADTGVAVGLGGALLWTTNAGQTWRSPAQAVTDQWLHAVHLLDAEAAVAVGSGGVIVGTEDGGHVWTLRASPTTQRLEHVAFDASGRGLAVGYDGTILLSLDRGLTWSVRASGTTSRLTDLAWRADAIVAAGGSGILLVSTDAGLTWSPLAPPETDSWNAAIFAPDDRLLLTGSYGSLWRSDPELGGWQDSQGGVNLPLASVAAATDEVAVAVGNGGTILRTADAGLTWAEIPAACDSFLWGIDFADAQTGLIVGKDGLILRSDDAGASWAPRVSGFTGTLYDVACLDAEHAVAVGAGCSILHTADGGLSWQEVGTPSAFDYHQAVFFVDPTHGWVCSFYGYILHSEDGGVTWQEQADTRLDLQDIHFSDRLHGVSVGGVDGAATMLTDDGGLNWLRQANPENVHLYGVVFSDPATGIAVGQGIFRTGDGAATWQRDPAFGVNFAGVCLLGDDVALAVGQGGAILRAGPDGITGVTDLPAPRRAALAVRPNPFNPATTIACRVPRAGRVSLAVFDLRGRRVAVLVDEVRPAGGFEVVWAGTDAAGRPAPSGSYFARLWLDGRPEGAALRLSLVK